MQPELNIFGLTLQTFGLMLGIAFIVCGALTAQYLKEIGKPVDWAYEFIFAAIVGGIVGSRLWWVAENWDEASDDLLGSLFSGAGLVFYGGAIGGAIVRAGLEPAQGLLEGRTLDMGAAPLAAGYAIGRIGCQLAGDGDYGIPWDGPWAMAYPNGTVPTDVPVHPTPVYETIVMGIVTVVLWRWRHRFRPGQPVRPVGRARRAPSASWWSSSAATTRSSPGLTQPQLISIAMILAGGAWLATHRGPAPRPRSRRRARAPHASGPDRDNARRMAAATAHVLPEASEIRDGRLLDRRLRRARRSRASTARPPTWSPRTTCAPGRARSPARWPRTTTGRARSCSPPRRCPCTPVLRVFAEEGLGCDVASGGELHLALHAGFAPERIYLHGNAKSRAELAMARRRRRRHDRARQRRRGAAAVRAARRPRRSACCCVSRPASTPTRTRRSSPARRARSSASRPTTPAR